MKLNLIGLSPKLDRKTIHKAARFYAAELMHPRVANSLQVQIKFVKDLLKNTDHYATVEYPEDGEPSLPRDFKVEVDKSLNMYHTLLSIGHEFIHIKQFATGEFKDNYVRLDRKVKWRGKLFNANKFDGSFDSPIEVEAHKQEKKLYRKFKRSLIHDITK